MRHLKLVLPMAVMFMAVTACEKSNDMPVDTGYANGVYIVNEGSFMSNNGSISYFNPGNNTITNGIFEAANGRVLGDVVQSIGLANDTLGYIVVNNSFKVEIVDVRTFITVAEPVPVDYPRCFLQVGSGKGYLSSGRYQGYLQVFDLLTSSITDSIKVGFGPESMILLDNYVYVANSGGWGSDSTISVVNVNNNLVVDTFYVGKVPVDLALDQNDHLWVYCKGYTNYAEIETDAWLHKIDPATGDIRWQMKVGKALDYSATPPRCAVSADGETIYYLRPDGVYAIQAGSPEVPTEPLITGSFYGLDVNPSDSKIYVFESGFTGNGKMKIYSDDGIPEAEGTVGIGPSGAVFNIY